MILVDTSVWIDHLHHTNPKLRDLLHHDEIGFHPLVIEELATGSLATRDDTLRYLSYLHRTAVDPRQKTVPGGGGAGDLLSRRLHRVRIDTPVAR